MQIDLPDQTIREVEALLAKRGKATSISEFVDNTLQRALFFETVREIKRQNADVAPGELDRLIDEAVNAVRTEARGAASGAIRS